MGVIENAKSRSEIEQGIQQAIADGNPEDVLSALVSTLINVSSHVGYPEAELAEAMRGAWVSLRMAKVTATVEPITPPSKIIL